jgi:DNA primase
VAYADFSPLQGRRVFLCPDPDKAGRQARDELLLRLRGVASEVWLIDTDDMPEGWDIADAVEDDGWDGARLDHWLNEPIAGVARLHKHDYGDEPVRAGLIAPDATVPGMLALVPSRAPPRKQTRTSPKVKNWDLADWREKLILSTNKKDGKQTPPCRSSTPRSGKGCSRGTSSGNASRRRARRRGVTSRSSGPITTTPSSPAGTTAPGCTSPG